jgi:outer membrane receptor protein involved in Fe transport
MPNPPARYDAAGNAGVINIRTKKSRTGGFNGGINVAYGQGKYARTNNSFNFNYRNQKINVFGTASYAINNGLNDLDIFRYYYKGDGALRSTFFQNSFIRNTSYSTNLKLGLDYFVSPKTTIGVLVNGILRPSDSKTINKSIVANASGATDSLITADNKEHIHWKKGSLNVNYLHKYNADKELSFDVDYIVYHSQQDQVFLNGIFEPSGNLKSRDGLTGDLPSDITIYSAKGDYTHSLTSTTKVAAGAKVSYVSTDNAANYFTVINNITETDYDKTNHFLYRETINAAYLNLNKDWSRLSLQAGLRLENTISDGHQLGNVTKPDSTFRRSYTNLFPTVYLLYKLDTLSTHQISLSYGRRIDRPYYQDLNPFISPLDKFSIYVGNPYLKPTFTNTFELSHIFKNKITTTLFYNATSDIVEETIDLANSIYVSRPANIGKSSVLGLSVTGSLKPARWWTTTLFAEVQNRSYKGIVYDYPLDTGAVYFGTNMANQFTLGKGWTAELSGNYRTGILVGQIISGQTGRLNAGIAKKVFDNKGSVKLNFRDVFRTGLNHGIITSIKGAYATYHNWGDTRTFTLSFSYNFGKTTASPRTRNSGAENEQNRVKN